MTKHSIYGTLNRALEWIGAIPSEPEPKVDEPPPRTKADLILEEVASQRQLFDELELRINSVSGAVENLPRPSSELFTGAAEILGDRLDMLQAKISVLTDEVKELRAESQIAGQSFQRIGHSAQRLGGTRYYWVEGPSDMVPINYDALMVRGHGGLGEAIDLQSVDLQSGDLNSITLGQSTVAEEKDLLAPLEGRIVELLNSEGQLVMRGGEAGKTTYRRVPRPARP